jgi:hypothetical protein
VGSLRVVMVEFLVHVVSEHSLVVKSQLAGLGRRSGPFAKFRVSKAGRLRHSLDLEAAAVQVLMGYEQVGTESAAFLAKSLRCAASAGAMVFPLSSVIWAANFRSSLTPLASLEAVPSLRSVLASGAGFLGRW